ncbi:MAG: AAA family ATPase [Rivularia sp. (in: cyanobacteria)]
MKQSQNDNKELASQPKWTLEEIALSSTIRDEIKEIIAYVHNRKKLLNEWKFNRFLKLGSGLAINFYGLPGTGKSITAEAIAHELKMSIIKVNYGDIESELHGGTSKNLSKIFDDAKRTQSVLFFDEADTILSQRIGKPSQSSDHAVNSSKSTLLTLLNDFDGIIIFATNSFETYDPAFLRRILFHIEFTAPDLAARTALWEFHLSEKVPKSITYDTAASLSEGLCGGDIRNIAIKLGLNLLVGKVSQIDEEIFKQEVEQYRINKQRNLSFSPSESKE